MPSHGGIHSPQRTNGASLVHAAISLHLCLSAVPLQDSNSCSNSLTPQTDHHKAQHLHNSYRSITSQQTPLSAGKLRDTNKFCWMRVSQPLLNVLGPFPFQTPFLWLGSVASQTGFKELQVSASSATNWQEQNLWVPIHLSIWVRYFSEIGLHSV